MSAPHPFARHGHGPLLRLVVTVAAGASLVACSRQATPVDSQVAVRVNQSEISVHQVQAALQLQPRLISVAGEQAPARMLEALIDQELAAQAAKSQKIDAEPGVIQQVETLRREALARAYQERMATKATLPSTDEIDRYYDSKPALFAQRRLYILQETLVEASPDQLARVEPAVAAAKSPDDLARALREIGVRSSARQLAEAAEDLPMYVVEPLAKAEPGRSLTFPPPGGARILTVISASKAPIDRRAATEAITNYIVAERRRELVGEAMKSLRQSAKLEYVGNFAKARAAGDAATR